MKTRGVAIGFASLTIAEQQVPSRILILKAGDIGWENLSGVKLDAEQATEIIAHFRKHGTQIPIDYEHTSALDPGEKGIKAIAAGWITDLQWVEGQGLYATVEWTEQAKQEILSGQYKYYSPVILSDKKTNAIERLHSVALTNMPRTRNQRELLAASIGVTLDRTEAGEKTMDLKALKAALIAVGVKLAEDANDDSILAATVEYVGTMKAAKDSPSPLTAIAAKLGLAKDATSEMIVAKVDAMQVDTVPAVEYKALAAKVETLESASRDRAGQEAVAYGIETAKINPNNAPLLDLYRLEAKSDPVAFKKKLDLMTALYSVDRVIKASANLDGSNDAATGEEQLIAKEVEACKGDRKAAFINLQKNLIAERMDVGLRKDVAVAHCTAQYPLIFGTGR